MAERATRQVAAGEPVVVVNAPARFVSRGGEKLDAALERFGVDPAGRHVLDAGASTGGFTDCLLQRGATAVVAADVGRAQLHERLRADPRVTVIDRCNIRTADLDALGGQTFGLVVADLSFISLRPVAGQLVGWVEPGGDVVVLIKPQFEAERVEASRGKGVIRDPAVWRRALGDVLSAFDRAGATMMGLMVSPLRGAEGNVEFLAHLRVPAGAAVDGGPGQTAAAAIDAAVAEAASSMGPPSVAGS